MLRHVTIAFLLINYAMSAPPLRLTIDCSDERVDQYESSRSSGYGRASHFNVDSFCDLIHDAIPKAVQDGKFILIEPDADQEGFADTQLPMAISPPNGFIPTLGLPKLKIPRLRIPKLNVPRLQASAGSFKAPSVGAPMSFSPMLLDEDSSVEKMEKFKKGVKKMLHFVKVLGQIDQYLSERIRIVVDKVSKTLAE